MSDDKTLTRIPHFDGHYDHWSELMENLLRAKGLWNLGGLEVMDPCGTFVPVDPLPGTVIVNLGDIAVAWSNGRLRNVQHRVKCKGAGLRFSIATFLSPEADRVVEALPEFVNEEKPRLFVPFTYEEFRKLRSTTKLKAGEALQLVRLQN